MSRIEIPGYYFDEDKKKYFKVSNFNKKVEDVNESIDRISTLRIISDWKFNNRLNIYNDPHVKRDLQLRKLRCGKKITSIPHIKSIVTIDDKIFVNNYEKVRYCHIGDTELNDEIVFTKPLPIIKMKKSLGLCILRQDKKFELTLYDKSNTTIHIEDFNLIGDFVIDEYLIITLNKSIEIMDLSKRKTDRIPNKGQDYLCLSKYGRQCVVGSRRGELSVIDKRLKGLNLVYKYPTTVCEVQVQDHLMVLAGLNNNLKLFDLRNMNKPIIDYNHYKNKYDMDVKLQIIDDLIIIKDCSNRLLFYNLYDTNSIWDIERINNFSFYNQTSAIIYNEYLQYLNT